MQENIKSILRSAIGSDKYTFKKADWYDGFITTYENEQDDTKSMSYCEGYNQAQIDMRLKVEEITKTITDMISHEVLQHSREVYIGSSSFLLADTDKIMFSLTTANPQN